MEVKSEATAPVDNGGECEEGDELERKLAVSFVSEDVSIFVELKCDVDGGGEVLHCLDEPLSSLRTHCDEWD